ncbi:MAG: ribonuclease HI family protein [Deltaproteobacteria bacterium]|jgi:probable phosphoglycerate mutase|nr:ribonuclease HI family protein [Deltaproteobacteria bacterium]
MENTETFVLFADGSSINNPGPAGAGAVLLDSGGELVFRLCMPLGKGTNNFAEYKALIYGAGEALGRGVRDIEIRMDSMLVVNQMNGNWKVKNQQLQALVALAKDVLAGFDGWRLSYIPREQNALADAAAKEASALSMAGKA